MAEKSVSYPISPAQLKRVDLRGVQVYPFASADDLIDFADSHKGILVAVNALKIHNATPQTRSIINSNIGYCDGAGAVMAAKQKGISDIARIPGCELWLNIVERFSSKGRTFYFIGAKPRVHDETIARLNRDFPGLRIVGHRDGYLRTDAERQALIDDVVEKRPDFVFVAMGSPMQELLMSEMQARHPKAVYQGLGGSFDVYTGNVPRAPKWWIDHNMEFAYRLIRQPKRLWRNLPYLRFAWWLLLKKF